MIKRISIIMFTILAITVQSFAQFQKGDNELSLSGTINHNFNSLYRHSQSNIILTVGFGKFITPNIQIGIQPTINFWSNTYSYWVGTKEEEESESDLTIDFAFCMNYNIQSESLVVPYLTVQYQITDIPQGGVEIMDMSSLGLGSGLRCFIVKNAAINSTLLYNFPLKDAKYKYKNLSVLLGLSIIF